MDRFSNYFMPERIILSIVSLVMLFLTMKQQGYFTRVIVTGLVIGILITWINIPLLISMGLLIYTLCSLLVVIFSFTETNLLIFERVVIGVTGLLIFIGNTMSILHLRYANEVKLLMILPVIGYSLILIKTNWKFRSETGFMFILTISCLIKFMKLWI